MGPCQAADRHLHRHREHDGFVSTLREVLLPVIDATAAYAAFGARAPRPVLQSERARDELLGDLDVGRVGMLLDVALDLAERFRVDAGPSITRVRVRVRVLVGPGWHVLVP